MTKPRRNSTETQQQETPVVQAGVTPTEHEQMVAVAAYYLAEQRGFSSGQEMEDWLRAEKDIESLMAGTDAEN
ncbi:MAG: DUF2934 domain-containing protein [Candidatus Nitricoxidivorans perseverans]|uniref:DUF2934 domain-containing protein n=1 Tax=Candidatus Nitricoxidivorans perseverans TaxID=2975601 RepID=A0AA49FM18_9PROT|nr:MAG: DUF2934 domain-containing protein [Candidatus Nitricoxidivorans perseverans]